MKIIIIETKSACTFTVAAIINSLSSQQLPIWNLKKYKGQMSLQESTYYKIELDISILEDPQMLKTDGIFAN